MEGACLHKEVGAGRPDVCRLQDCGGCRRRLWERHLHEHLQKTLTVLETSHSCMSTASLLRQYLDSGCVQKCGRMTACFRVATTAAVSTGGGRAPKFNRETPAHLVGSPLDRVVDRGRRHVGVPVGPPIDARVQRRELAAAVRQRPLAHSVCCRVHHQPGQLAALAAAAANEKTVRSVRDAVRSRHACHVVVAGPGSFAHLDAHRRPEAVTQHACQATWRSAREVRVSDVF